MRLNCSHEQSKIAFNQKHSIVHAQDYPDSAETASCACNSCCNAASTIADMQTCCPFMQHAANYSTQQHNTGQQCC